MVKKLVSRSLTMILFATLVGQMPEPANAVAGLYAFSTAGSVGVNGPTQAMITSAYSGTNLASQIIIRTRGIQEWTVPATDTYSVTAAGASGGYVSGKLGGKGRVITTQIYLSQGQVIKVLVGQEGGRSEFATGAAGGGGGGTFIVDSATASPLLVVGGGGGGAKSKTSYANVNGSNGLDAALYNSTAGVAGTGGGAGGTNGGGGVSNSTWCAGGGGGMTGNGANGLTYAFGGNSYSNGGVGGANYAPSNTTNIAGGFGGGGGSMSMDNYETNGGGGGGYSGGGCGRNASNTGGGGGGGNYYTGAYISNSLNTGDGYVTFTRMNLQAATIIITGPSISTLRSLTTLTTTSNAPGVVTFFGNGKRLAGCISIKTQVSGLNYLATCLWLPSVRGSTAIYAVITPSETYGVGSSLSFNVGVATRTGNR